MLEPGIHFGKVVDCAISLSKKGDPQAVVMFQIEGERLAWFGSFNGGAKEITLKTLLTCGLKGGVECLADGPSCLDTNSELSIGVEENEWQGKKSLRVKWVGNNVLADKLTKAQAVQKMAGLNLGGDLLKLRQGMGLANNSSEDIPF